MAILSRAGELRVRSRHARMAEGSRFEVGDEPTITGFPVTGLPGATFPGVKAKATRAAARCDRRGSWSSEPLIARTWPTGEILPGVVRQPAGRAKATSPPPSCRRRARVCGSFSTAPWTEAKRPTGPEGRYRGPPGCPPPHRIRLVVEQLVNLAFSALARRRVQCVEAAADDMGGQRWVALDGAFNFRDLGGYATRQGARLRWGSLYRSDALHHLSADDVEMLASLGVDRVIDLRAPDEIAAVGRGVLSHGPFDYLNAPVLPSTTGEALGAPPGDDLGERYLWYLDVGRQALVDAIAALAEPGRGAVVFHCAAGKDRTGVLAAIVLAMLDVGYDDIVADYALTNLALPSILDRLAADPLHGAAVAQIPADRRTVRPEAMRRFLQLLDDTYGGARSWAESAGLAPTCIDAVRVRLDVTA